MTLPLPIKELPEEYKKYYGICPVCRGTGLMDNGKLCTNCNDIWYDPKGYVCLRKDNHEPCVHTYDCIETGNCYMRYRCRNCGNETECDSSG